MNDLQKKIHIYKYTQHIKQHIHTQHTKYNNEIFINLNILHNSNLNIINIKSKKKQTLVKLL